MELAEPMGHTGKRVTDRFFKKPRNEFADEELVELAAVIAYENFRGRFNQVFGIEANGLCHLPEVQTATEAATEAATKRSHLVQNDRQVGLCHIAGI